MKNILVVLDGSESDEHVLGQAVQVATANGGDIHLFMVVYDSIEELNRYVGFDNYAEVKQAILDEAEVRVASANRQVRRSLLILYALGTALAFQCGVRSSKTLGRLNN